MARVDPEKTTEAAEAVLDRVISLAPTTSASHLLELAQSVAAIAEHLKTDAPASVPGSRRA